jgi:polyisoprenoid-binding protein YceI
MSIATAVPAGVWNIDTSHTTVNFSVRHMMVSKVRGKFATFGGTIVIAEDPTASTLEASVDMASVDTGDAGRDEHLRTSDFFDIQTHPTMTFTSTSITPSGGDYELTGDLTIRGVTRPVTFELEPGGVGTDPWGNTRAGFTATTTINRKDWGLEYNAVLEGGGVLIGEKVTIELDVEATLAS